MKKQSIENKTATAAPEHEGDKLRGTGQSVVEKTLQTELPTSPSTAYKPVRKRFIAALVLQLAILCYLGCSNLYVLAAGRTVTLKTMPVDPRDIFRGDYVALRYDISTVPTKASFEHGQKVYVTLKRGNPYWTACGASEKLPPLTEDQVAIKGTVDSWGAGPIYVHYGIEQYFLPEGKATFPAVSHTPDVEVAIDRSGNAVIKQLIFRNQKN
jgi:uncharacterized membrane-anchored protein